MAWDVYFTAVAEEWILGLDDDDYTRCSRPSNFCTLNDIRAKCPLFPDARERVDEIKRAMHLEIALAELRQPDPGRRDARHLTPERRAHREGTRRAPVHP